jgi:hypothetical protein
LALQSAVDLDLELWAVERVADVFRKTYEMSLTLNKVKS